MRQPLGVQPGERRTAAGLQRTGLTVLRQEGRHPVDLRDGQQSAGAQGGADAREGGGGVVQVVQGRRGPDEVGVGDPGQSRPGVGLQRPHAVAESPLPRRRDDSLQHGGGVVDGGHPGGGELFQQGEGAGAGAGAEVDDVPDVVTGQTGDTTGERGQVGCEESGVEVEDLGEAVGSRAGVMGVGRTLMRMRVREWVLVLVLLVCVSHEAERTERLRHLHTGLPKTQEGGAGSDPVRKRGDAEVINSAARAHNHSPYGWSFWERGQMTRRPT